MATQQLFRLHGYSELKKWKRKRKRGKQNYKPSSETNTHQRELIISYGTGKPLPLKQSHDINIQRKPMDEHKMSWEIAKKDETRSRAKERETADTRNRTRSDERSDKSKAKSTSAMVPRPRSKGRPFRPRFNDPVSLYHWYQREWKHFRKHIPGELTHADVRWNVRQKLLDPQPITKMTKKCESEVKSRQSKTFGSENNFILK